MLLESIHIHTETKRKTHVCRIDATAILMQYEYMESQLNPFHIKHSREKKAYFLWIVQVSANGIVIQQTKVSPFSIVNGYEKYDWIPDFFPFCATALKRFTAMPMRIIWHLLKNFLIAFPFFSLLLNKSNSGACIFVNFFFCRPKPMNQNVSNGNYTKRRRRRKKINIKREKSHRVQLIQLKIIIMKKKEPVSNFLYSSIHSFIIPFVLVPVSNDDLTRILLMKLNFNYDLWMCLRESSEKSRKNDARASMLV